MRFVHYIKRKFHERRAKKASENAADHAARNTANATIWIAILTAVIAGVGFLQWRVLREHGEAMQGQLEAMRGQLAEMKSTGKQTDALIEATSRQAEAAIKQANAAKITAEAAAQSNEIANSALLETNRPLVALSRIDVVGAVGINQALNVTAIIRNSGRSPALDVRGQFGMGKTTSKFLGRLALKESKAGGQSFLQQGAEMSWPLGPIPSEIMNKELVESIENGTAIIVLYGRVDYSDSFKRHRITKICWYFDRILHQFSTCPIGNTGT